ncbi:MarR family winged helix-turn-helix transcriptional regulator [Streptomyces albus]|uniref:MarR family winged helix-turn-helix transcriptional regulator n=1 Tax=Streptomyces sp. NRRL F-5639 TaxID=1463867 RepID=UPI0004C8C423|nr:MarR family winged helix-turn-helix transcriptional regulator [Streptomyces sp. NRRL F-5639]
MGQWGYERQHDALDVDDEAEAEQRDALEGVRDWVDDHVDRWRPVLPDLDPDVEGSVTRMQFLTDRLRRFAERALAELGLSREEHETLHVLVSGGGRVGITRLATDLGTAPAELTERLEALARRGFLTLPGADATADAADAEGRPAEGRGGEVGLTDEGRAMWRRAVEASGAEERRLLSALDWYEQQLLATLLRRVVLKAEGYGED